MLLVPALPAAAQTKAAWKHFDAYVQQGMRDWQVPGLSIVVVRNDSVVFLKGYGVRTLGTAGPVDARTLFGIMSTTKAMTAMALAMLVDEGKVRWEDPVTKWLPAFQTADALLTRDLRVVDLLTHSTGLPNADLLWVRGDLDEAEVLRRVRGLAPTYPLRGGFIYQNVMYGVAGAVIAQASGMSWGEFLQRRLFTPLAMSRTHPTYAAVVAAKDGNVSSAHYRIRDTVRAIADESVDHVPAAGAVWSTAEDMGRWLRFLLDSSRVDGRRLVSDSAFRRLFQPQSFVGASEFYPTAQLTKPHWTTYGLGWFQQDYRGEMVQMHTGSLDGRTAIIGLIPERRLGVYVFGNLDHAELRHALMWKTFDVLLGAPERDWSRELLALYGARRARADSARRAVEAARVTGTSPSLPLDRYAGRYEHPVWGDIEISAASGTLRLRAGTNPMTAGPLEHWHYDTFRAALGDGRDAPMLATFALDARGTPAQLTLMGERFARTAPVTQ
ncbi:MAG TPA: serine hydrolase [Gemmatimonadales bacterium]|nr:serine hydrolase [Gemmatimonadales bacterium]